MDPKQSVIFAAEFISAHGDENKFYTEQHIEALVAVMKKKRFGNMEWAVILDAEFLMDDYPVDSYWSLLECEQFKYLILRYGEILGESYVMTKEEYRRVKYRINRMYRRTYFFIPRHAYWPLTMIEDIPEPPSKYTIPTVPTIEHTLPANPPSTQPPVTLKPIPEMVANITFPTLEMVSSGQRSRSGVGWWMGVGVVVCRLVMIW